MVRGRGRHRFVAPLATCLHTKGDTSPPFVPHVVGGGGGKFGDHCADGPLHDVQSDATVLNVFKVAA